MDFREIIKIIRHQKDFTQEQLARELNISYSTINRWENGHTTPSKLAQMRILDFCKQNKIIVPEFKDFGQE